MSSFSVYSNTNESTLVSNIFIDEYLADANAAQVKVYLYLLRMSGAATSVSDMADKFNYTEKDICRALKYWEKHGLVSLDYDLNGSLIGLRLLTVPGMTAVPQKQNFIVHPNSAFVPAYVSSSEIGYSMRVYDSNEGSMDLTVPASGMPVITQPSAEPAPAFVKRDYTADEMKALKERSDIKQLIFVASQYLGKPLSPSDIKSLLFISEELHFSEDLIDYLLAYCVDKDKKSFRYIETVAINWANEGITTVAMAKANNGKYDRTVYTVMKALGKDAVPTEKEADYVRRWTNEFGFSTDIILEACERCVMSTDRNRFAYADSILKNWHKAGVVTKGDISSVDTRAPKHKKASGQTSFHQLDMKHNYDYSAMEKELLGQD